MTEVGGRRLRSDFKGGACRDFLRDLKITFLTTHLPTTSRIWNALIAVSILPSLKAIEMVVPIRRTIR
jgi:hypothetical protein